MSGGVVDLEELRVLYKVNDVQGLPLSELRELYRKAIEDLIQEKAKFEEFECKYYSKNIFVLFYVYCMDDDL